MRWLPLLTLLLCAPLARATTLRALDDAALLSQSRVAAIARVVDVSSKQAGRRIVTVAKVVVSRPLKGSKSGDELSVLIPGGAAGEWVQHVEGAPQPKVGETCLVFLEDGPGGLLQFTGLELGYGRVRADASVPGGFVVDRRITARLVGPDGREVAPPASVVPLMPLLDRLEAGARR
ncbi:MAG: hypothetical protein RL199_1497 [Pseudomonadota bacterium]